MDVFKVGSTVGLTRCWVEELYRSTARVGCPLISMSSNPFTKRLEIVPNAPITNGITVTIMFHCFFFFFFFFQFFGKVIISLFAFFDFTLWSVETAKFDIWQASSFFLFLFFFFFLIITTRSGRRVGYRGSVCLSKSKKILCISFSWTYGQI